MKEKSCFFTGHRIIPLCEYEALKQGICQNVRSLIEKGVKYFYAGGALGFDTLAAQVILELKERYDISLILMLPCRSQTAKWGIRDVEIYEDILSKCDKYYYISNTYTSDCMLKRNREMADRCEFCISYMRKPFGGTAYTVRYAKENSCKIIAL